MTAGTLARVTTAGKTSDTEPTWTASGTTVTDGTVTWTVTKAVTDADKATSDEAKAGTSDKVITASTLKAAMDAAISSAIKTATAAIEKQVKLDAHPVGSYYFSDDSTSPADLFGGTWEALPAGYTLIAQGSGTDDFGSFSYTAGQKYGERLHKLTVDELASHSHSYTTIPKTWDQVNYSKDDLANWNESARQASAGVTYWTDSTGGDKAHNNVPPVKAVYAWLRIA
jgi:hypothetical protein